jgi:adenylate cyclase class 2
MAEWDGLENQEIEIKFYVRDLISPEEHIQALGANQVQARTHEYNLRFDTPGGDLAQGDQILRLRKDTVDRVTYKGPGFSLDGVLHRREIELSVSDFDAAQALLEALGYQVSMVYEKYRTIYALGDVLVMLDEMPFGKFIEIEGPDGTRIREASHKLGLRWAARIAANYAVLFQAACQSLEIKTHNLTFADFDDIVVLPDHLGVHLADGSKDG